MLALRIELLGGRYVATAYNDRARAEWPPHPARLFSALVDTWASGEPTSAEGEQERMALVWLERQRPPAIAASALRDVAERSAMTVFVPVNDIAVVAQPESARAKLMEAVSALDRATGSARDMEKAVQKAAHKLRDDTAKAIAVSTKAEKAGVDAARRIMPDQRLRQARTFPSVTPPDPMVTFVWDAEPEAMIRRALQRLAARLSRLGHSSSLVAASLVEEAPPRHYIPDDDGTLTLRVVGHGQLRRLEEAYELHREVEPRVLPCAFGRYREGKEVAQAPLPSSVFSDDWIVLARSGGPRLPSTSVVGVASQLRRALLSAAEPPIPEVVSGHDGEGAPATSDHVAFVPLVDVGHEHATGAILGIAMAPPRALTAIDRRHLLRSLGALEARNRGEGDVLDAPPIELLLGEAGKLVLERVEWGEHRLVGLRPQTWCRPSRRWASATPVALDRNPGDLHDPDPVKRAKAFTAATEAVADAVTRIGLPRPAEIDVLRSCVLAGTAKPRSFPRYPISKERSQRVLVHVRLAFDTLVRGPLLLGSGRYLGLGLCRPTDEQGERRGQK